MNLPLELVTVIFQYANLRCSVCRKRLLHPIYLLQVSNNYRYVCSQKCLKFKQTCIIH